MLAALVAVALVPGVAGARAALSGLVATSLHSRSSGTAVAGGLRHGVAVAPWGADLRGGSWVLGALGRQYVHGDALAALREAAGQERTRTARRGGSPGPWRVLEVGWRGGGLFPPHLTHQDGLSVDLAVPLLRGRVPVGPWVAFGYGVTVPAEPEGRELALDPPRLARFFDALCATAPAHGVAVQTLILWAPLQPAVRGRMRSTCRERLVDAPLPHDDHVHVTFTRGSP